MLSRPRTLFNEFIAQSDSCFHQLVTETESLRRNAYSDKTYPASKAKQFTVVIYPLSAYAQEDRELDGKYAFHL